MIHSQKNLNMFSRNLRSTFTKLSSGAKTMANKTVSRFKHKGSISEIPDESYSLFNVLLCFSWEEHMKKLNANYEETCKLVCVILL